MPGEGGGEVLRTATQKELLQMSMESHTKQYDVTFKQCAGSRDEAKALLMEMSLKFSSISSLILLSICWLLGVANDHSLFGAHTTPLSPRRGKILLA